LQKIRFIPLIASALLLLTSCEKKEDLWQLPPAGEEKIARFRMGENYETSVFFNLETGEYVMRNYDEWDLAFASGVNDFYLVMNGGKGIQVYNTHDTAFSKTTFQALITSPWQWDNPNGRTDSTAFCNWRDTSGASLMETYIIDLGPLADPRYQKMQVTAGNATSYTIRYANINNSNPGSATIIKDASRNFAYYSFFSNQTIDFEPASSNWQLFFQKYRAVYYDMDPITPYIVTGALINTRGVTIAETRTLPFEEITHENAAKLLLTSKADEIGYDWKFYDLNGSGKYVIDPKKVYIIKDQQGVYYKLKFTGFYDNGIKGSPEFIYKRL
jgi:hypothetical protein